LKLYYYNMNEDKAKDMKLARSNLKFEMRCQNKYIDYYDAEPDLHVVGFNEPNIDISIDLYPEVFTKLYNLYDPASYDESLLNLLKAKYKLDESAMDDLSKVFKSNKLPLMKASQTRQIILSHQDKPSDITVLIGNLMSSMPNLSNIVIDNSDPLKIVLANCSDKKNLILKSTNYKAEAKQLEALFGYSTYDMISKNVRLSRVKKHNYLNTVKAMIEHQKARKKINETCLLRIIRSVIDSCIEGDTNEAGESMEDTLQSHLSHFIITDEDEEDISEVDEPTFEVSKYKLKLG